MDHVIRGSHGEVSGFQTIATCRDGLKNSRDKSVTSTFVWARTSPYLQETRKSATSPTNQRRRHGFVADLSRTSSDSGIWDSLITGSFHVGFPKPMPVYLCSVGLGRRASYVPHYAINFGYK